MFSKAKGRFYPEIIIPQNKKPNRFYATPLIGWVIKIILIIPLMIEILALEIASIFTLFVGMFYILATGKYWKVNYEINAAIMRLGLKMTYFLYGFTDKYPSFSLDRTEGFSIALPYPKKPSKYFAIPLLGFVSRFVLLVPFLIYNQIISYAACIALIIGSPTVFFTGKYPESIYEILRDSVRVSIAMSIYLIGFSDSYPSMWISMNHKLIKIILIILGIIAFFFNDMGRFTYMSQIDKNSYSNSTYDRAEKNLPSTY